MLKTIMSDNKKTAYLELILGPMFSGKTSRLVEIYKQCNFCNISVQTINHSIDLRYDEELMSTHDKIKIPCIKTNKISEIWNNNLEENKLRNADVILINEGQFFEDLYDNVLDMLKNGKKVYICGLDGDFERKKFGQILDLIPICDKVNKLTSLCGICKNGIPGIFSKRITSEKQQTVVGSENYIPVCRECYEK
uniref:thymidine kinase n=1 Tax=viral metagenome TaxID=1070528 RepID=A0A6C0KP53_9ZZZZ